MKVYILQIISFNVELQKIDEISKTFSTLFIATLVIQITVIYEMGMRYLSIQEIG